MGCIPAMHAMSRCRRAVIIEDPNMAWGPFGLRDENNQVDMLKDFIEVLNRENFDPTYNTTATAVEHELESLYCMEEICALRKKARTSKLFARSAERGPG